MDYRRRTCSRRRSSPDGSLLAVSILAGGVQFHDVASGRRIGLPMGSEDGAKGCGSGLRWTDDGAGVWISVAGGPIRVVADADRWREIACSIVHRELTADEWATSVSDTAPQVSACPAG